MAINLRFNVFKEAKLCSSECVEVLDDGTRSKLNAASVVSCVGCGKKCHLECHKVPNQLINAVKSVPMNNRVHAYFGEQSYMRLVCDNCANWLNCDVPKDSSPTFLTLFTKLAERLIKEKYVLKEKDITDQESTAASSSGRKRKKLSMDDSDETNLLGDLMKIMQSCVGKLDRIEQKCDVGSSNVESGFSAMKEAMKASNNDIGKSVQNICDTLLNVNDKLTNVDLKIDSKHDVIESGIQSGFNDLLNKTEKLLSPLTPRGKVRRNDLRTRALVNSAIMATTPRAKPNYTSYADILKKPGTSSDDVIFGAVVPRRLFDGQQGNRPAIGPNFRHKDAVHLRYVDPMVTPKKMICILRKNSRLNEELDIDINSVEITRLTKRTMTEEDIRSYKFGVSYRIGVKSDLYDILNDGSVFAPHWEMRRWIDKGRNRPNDVPANTMAHDRTNSVDFLVDDTNQMTAD